MPNYIGGEPGFQRYQLPGGNNYNQVELGSSVSPGGRAGYNQADGGSSFYGALGDASLGGLGGGEVITERAIPRNYQTLPNLPNLAPRAVPSLSALGGFLRGGWGGNDTNTSFSPLDAFARLAPRPQPLQAPAWNPALPMASDMRTLQGLPNLSTVLPPSATQQQLFALLRLGLLRQLLGQRAI